jgi:hypothetical protein
VLLLAYLSKVWQKCMHADHEFTNWREQLGVLIRNSQEKKRLAEGAGVKPITLQRWADGDSQPRETNLLRLAQELPPDIAARFLNLATVEFPSLAQVHFENNIIAPEINADLYNQVLQLYAKMPVMLARQQLQDLILKHALTHLDPTGGGMSLTLLYCVPPRLGEKVRALCQNGGQGTPPWPRDLERKVLFVGAESLAGSTASACHAIMADRHEDPQYNWDKDEESAAASPILRQAKIAGVLVASSARPRHFTQAHKNLLELYAHLIVLMFNPAEFYDSSQVQQLGVIPRIAAQEHHVQDIDRRATQKLAELQARGDSSVTMQQARHYVWQDIVDELLGLPPER